MRGRWVWTGMWARRLRIRRATSFVDKDMLFLAPYGTAAGWPQGRS